MSVFPLTRPPLFFSLTDEGTVLAQGRLDEGEDTVGDFEIEIAPGETFDGMTFDELVERATKGDSK